MKKKLSMDLYYCPQHPLPSTPVEQLRSNETENY